MLGDLGESAVYSPVAIPACVHSDGRTREVSSHPDPAVMSSVSFGAALQGDCLL